MAYTTIDDPSAYFNTLLYTGNGGSSRDLTFSANAGDFQADWLWFKQRSQASRSHNVYDSVRGNSQRIETDNTGAEEEQTGLHKTFNTNGFTIGAGNIVNENNQTFVTWGWKAGTTFTNDASSTGIGSIDSAGNFNNDAGFSIVSYTGTGSNGTIKHGLNTVPKVVWAKSRTHGTNWTLGFNINSSINFTDAFALNQNYALEDYAGYWNDTAPTSSVVSLGAHQNTNKSGENYIAYCFSEKQGYSKFGSYTGNGNADGTFVYTGFKPAITITKRTDSTSDWQLNDNKRDPFNPSNKLLLPNTSGAEATSSSYNMDFLSNGFKFRNTLNNQNASGSYIYMAFAENPFVSSSGVPTTAR